MSFKIGDKFIVNTKGWGLFYFYGTIQTIGYFHNDLCAFYDGFNGSSWFIEKKDMLPLTPLLEALC